MQEMESQRRAAVAEAAQQRSAAEATNRAAAEALAEYETCDQGPNFVLTF